MEQREMDKILGKAEVLIEALPYIQKFNRKIIVVKYGGSAMSNEELQKNVVKDVTLLKLVGFKPIIVHGGGKEISRWVGKVGKEAKFVNGLRVTDEETMEIAEMVLNKVNKNLVRMVEELGVKAIGISGKDAGLLQCTKKCPRHCSLQEQRLHINRNLRIRSLGKSDQRKRGSDRKGHRRHLREEPVPIQMLLL